MNDNNNEKETFGLFEKITLSQLEKLGKNNWEKAVIVFTEDSFPVKYPEKERAYLVNSSEDYFDPDKCGNSLMSTCLDGTDKGLDLQYYFPEQWAVEYCFLVPGDYEVRK